MSPRSWADHADADDEPFWRAAPPSRPRPVTGGIQINATRGPVARTPWSARFLAVLEARGVGGRLARGRTYARRGQTVSLQVDAGAATARVQGSAARPYRVRIGVATLDKPQWTAVLDALAADASLTAALLAGELPREVEETFAAQGVALLPSGRGDLTMDCTCPDGTVPCKHLAAVFYLLAERFDADPFALLALRGRDRETVLDELRERRTRAPVAPPLPVDPGQFYRGSGLPDLPAGPRTPPDALLDQVPALPLAVRGHDVGDLLRPLYRALPDADG
jgi:SWIM zinc finger